jgi:hypothetical protein
MPLPPSSPPLTRAESSNFASTSLHRDVLEYIESLRARGDNRLHASDFGESPEGRQLPLLVLSAQGIRTPEAARAARLPVVLVMNGIHAGEVEGKEASLMLVRDLLAGHHGDLLERLVLVVLPLFNPDGNERISPENRRLDIARFTGQLGPDSGVGTRNTAAGINLNRDYMRQQAAEMRLLQQRVAQRWDAHLTIDCHATNGSIHRFALTYDIPHTVASGRVEPIDYMRERLLPAVRAAVKQSEELDTFYYGNFLRDEGGQGSGWITYTHHPRFGGNYRGLSNRLDLLLEAYSYISFEERVRATYAFLRETLRYVAANGAEIVELLADCRMPPAKIAVRYRLEAFDGIQAEIPTREPYALDGAPVIASVPWIGRFVAEELVTRPFAYAVPKEVGEHLLRHGLEVEHWLPGTMLQAEVAVVRGAASSAGREILEANASAWLEVEHRRMRRALPEGWCLVRTEQPRGAIAVYLCEAGSDDGLVACELVAAPAPGEEFPAWRVHAIEP